MRVIDSTIKIPQPYIIVQGNISNPNDAFLIVEGTVLTKIPSILDYVLIMMAAFHLFNMQYTQTLTNFFTLLECFILDHKVPKGKTRVMHLMSELMTD